MPSRLKGLHRLGWKAAVSWAAFIWLVPLAALVVIGLSSVGSNWEHLVSFMLLDYLGNSLGLTLGTLALAGVFGVTAAWLTSRYDFRGRRFAVSLQLLPLALPGFVAAAAWRNLFDFTGPVATVARGWGMEWTFTPPSGLGVGIFLLGFALYPYVFLSVKGSFQNLNLNLLETARLRGWGEGKLFFGIALPLVRPALLGGLSLVAMETLNEVGLPTLLGFSTFSTGIFRTWFGLGDLTTATQLALTLLGLWIVFFLIERSTRGKRQFTLTGGEKVKDRPKRLHGAGLVGLWALLLFPVIVGFFIPLFQILLWFGHLRDASFLHLASHVFQTLGTTLAACAFGLLILILIVFTRHFLDARFLGPVRFLVPLGYTLPGAVLAIGLMAVSLPLGYFGGQTMILGTWFGLVGALTIRFTGVGLPTLEAASRHGGTALTQVSLNLGRTPGQTLFRVHLPLWAPSLAAAACLMAIDLFKELPLSMVLRPFDFHTLATRTFEMVQNEVPADSAPSAFILVLLAWLAALGAQFFLDKRNNRAQP